MLCAFVGGMLQRTLKQKANIEGFFRSTHISALNRWSKRMAHRPKRLLN